MTTPIKIMVVDDEPIVCTRLKPVLEKNGFEVEAFENSREALKRLEEKRFEILVTDLKMPEIDGMELFRRVRTDFPDTKVIFITAFATMDTAREALKSGAFDFIPKPFRLNQLLEVIANAAESVEGDGGSR